MPREEKESFTLSIRDMITYCSIGVTVALAWGAFGTRVTLLEKSIQDHDKSIEEVRKKVDDLDKKVNVFDGRLRESEATVEDLFRTSRRLQSVLYGQGQMPQTAPSVQPEYQVQPVPTPPARQYEPQPGILPNRPPSGTEYRTDQNSNKK